jgi:hypothetical protein
MAWIEQTSDLGMWMPKIGEELIGEVIKIEEGMYGKNLDIKKDDGSIIKTPSHKVLQARLNKVKIGDKIKVVFVKEELPRLKGYQPTRIYSVAIEQQVEERVK